jgi:hypothetical protein
MDQTEIDEQTKLIEQSELLLELREWHRADWHERAGELCCAFETPGLEWYCKVKVTDDLSRVVTCCWRVAGNSAGYHHLPLHLRGSVDGRKIAHFVLGCVRETERAVAKSAERAAQQAPEIVTSAWAACA